MYVLMYVPICNVFSFYCHSSAVACNFKIIEIKCMSYKSGHSPPIANSYKHMVSARK